MNTSESWRISSCLSIMLLTGAVIALGVGHARTPAGNVTIDHSEVQLGKISEKEAADIHQAFYITNRTNRSVDVSAIDHSCSCTTASASLMHLEPGETSKISLAIDWSNHHGVQMTSAVVHLAQSVAPIEMTVTAIIDTGLAVTPETINFGLLKGGSTTSRLVFVGRTDSNTGGKLAVRPMPPQIPGITVKEVSGDGRSADGAWFEVVLQADALQQDSRNATIEFVPDDRSLRRVDLTIKYLPERKISPAAPTIRFKGPSNSEKVTFHVTGIKIQDLRFAIDNLSGSRQTDFRIKDVLPSKSCPTDLDVIVVRLPTDPDPGFESARLEAYIGDMKAASVALTKF